MRLRQDAVRNPRLAADPDHMDVFDALEEFVLAGALRSRSRDESAHSGKILVGARVNVLHEENLDFDPSGMTSRSGCSRLRPCTAPRVIARQGPNADTLARRRETRRTVTHP